MINQIPMFGFFTCQIQGKKVSTYFDKKRQAWRIQFWHPGGTQAQTIYDQNNEMVEFETQQDAVNAIANYFPGHLEDQNAE